MIRASQHPHRGRRFHLDAAGPSLAAITRVHIKEKDISQAIRRKYNGNAADTASFLVSLNTLLERTDLAPYARRVASCHSTN